MSEEEQALMRELMDVAERMAVFLRYDYAGGPAPWGLELDDVDGYDEIDYDLSADVKATLARFESLC